MITASPESAGTDSLRPWTLPGLRGEPVHSEQGQRVQPQSRCHQGHPWQRVGLGREGVGYAGGQSPWPGSIGVDSDEKLFISDDHVSRIFTYDKDGNFLDSWGTKGSGDGELNGPSGLVFDKDDNLYVVDALNNRIQKFTKDGKFLAKWGSQGSGQGQFNMPWGINIDKDGNVYVADWKNDRVQKFAPDGEYLATFGSPGTGDGEVKRPSSVATDSEGDVYIVDWGNKRLNIYDSDGTFLTAFIGDADRLPPGAQAMVDANPDYRKARRRVDLTPEQRFEARWR